MLTRPHRRRRNPARLGEAMQGGPWLAALLSYLTLAALLFARPAASHFATSYMGCGVDQPFFIWCLVWWPYALVHHLNPFVTKLIFAPAGLNLAWTTPIPLLSILALPLTKAVRPVATYNLLCVICPALSAFSAFLLCRYLTNAFWPSLMGGHLFGFSSHVLGHVLGGHPDCSAVFLVPPIVRLVLARLDGRMTQRSFGLWLLALLVAQFLIADELVATLTVASAAALIAGWIFGDNAGRSYYAQKPLPAAADDGFRPQRAAPRRDSGKIGWTIIAVARFSTARVIARLTPR